MRTIEVKVYKFDELSDNAKENAKRQLLSEYFWADAALESLKAFAREIGIEITNYSVDWDCVSRSSVFWRGKPTTRFIKEDLTGYCMDYELTKTFNKTHDVDDAIGEWLSACCKDYEYQFTDAYAADHFEANGYEFDEHGNLI